MRAKSPGAGPCAIGEDRGDRNAEGSSIGGPQIYPWLYEFRSTLESETSRVGAGSNCNGEQMGFQLFLLVGIENLGKFIGCSSA